MEALSERVGLRAAVLAVVFIGCAIGRAGESSGGPAAIAAEDPNELRWDLASGFDFDWDSVELSGKTLKGTDPRAAARSLIISAAIKILDTNDLVGVDTTCLGIVSVRDENNDEVRCLSREYRFLHRYEQVRWGYAGGNSFRDTLLPSAFAFIMELAPDQPAPSLLSRVEGYIYALYAEDTIEVNVPFGPPRDWINVTTDLRIAVLKDTPPPPGPLQLEARDSLSCSYYASPAAIYKVRTCVQSTTGRPVLGLEDPWSPAWFLGLGDYVVVRTYLYDHVKDRSMSLNSQNVTSDPWGQSGAVCSGWAEQDLNAYDVIRHVIAFHPVEVKIPFVLTNIPVPVVRSADE